MSVTHVRAPPIIFRFCSSKKNMHVIPSHFVKTKTKLRFAFVLANFATTIPR
jgi:hypothetical protein